MPSVQCAVGPVVCCDEIAAGVPHHRTPQLFYRGDDVGAEAIFVRERVPGGVQAAVDTAAYVLVERGNGEGERDSVKPE